MAQLSASVTWEYERNRNRMAETLKAIPGYLFQQHKLPRNNGIDLGSGSTGFMRNTLLADQINHHSWVEIDVNPYAVEFNKQLHPNSAIVEGSYHRLRNMGLEGRLDMVTGLSSLDSTVFLDRVLEEIASTLKPEGWFLHMQDLRAENGVCLQALKDEGLTPPFRMESADASGKNVLCFDVRGERVAVSELFRRRMATALKKTPSLNPVMNNWVLARRPIQRPQTQSKLPALSKTYYMNMILEHLHHPEPLEEAFAVVTLAQKK